MSFGLKFREEQGSITAVKGAPTAVIGLLAIMTWGPHDAWESDSFPEWQLKGGPPTVNGFAYLWAKAAYDIAGDGLRIVNQRVVHYTNIANKSSKTSTAATLGVDTDDNAATAGSITSSNPHPHALTSGQTLVITIDAGSPATATFTGVAAARETASGGPFTLANGQTLTVKIDGGALQTITFLTANFVDITNATATEVVAVLNAYFLAHGIAAIASVTSSTKVTITSLKKGTGSHVEVTNAGTATALDFSNAVANGTGNVVDIDAVTLAEEKTIIEAAVSGCVVSDAGGYTKITSNTTGLSSSVLVGASSTADTPIGFDNATHYGSDAGTFLRLTLNAKYDGDRGNNLAPKFSAAANGSAVFFNFAQLENGVQVGPVITNCALDPDSADYFVSKIGNASHSLFDVVDEAEGDLALPLLGTGATLSGGSDGLSSLGDTDFTGDQGAKTGLFGFDPRDDVPGTRDITILCIPDRPTSAVHNAAITYCEVYRSGNMLFIVDLPAGLTEEQAITYVTSTASIYELSDKACVFFDRIKVDNSRPDVYGNSTTRPTVTIPNSCVVAGVWARTDAARPGGVSDPPLGQVLGQVSPVVRGLEMGLASDPAKWEKLQSYRINTIIRTADGSPYFLLGPYTLRSDGQFPEIQEQRLIIFIKKSLENAHMRAMNQATEEGIRTAQAQAESFLRTLTEEPYRCFRTSRFSTAVKVDYSDALNRASTKILGQGFGKLSLATKKALTSLDVSLGQNFADVQAELAAAA